MVHAVAGGIEATKGTRDRQDKQDQLVRLASKVELVRQGRMETLGEQGPREIQVQKDRLGPLVQWAAPDRPDFLA